MTNTKKYSILLAEELALVREGIARLCEANGCFRVAGQCADGVAAMELLEAFQPDVAVIDFNLPKLFSLGDHPQNEELGRRHPVFGPGFQGRP